MEGTVTGMNEVVTAMTTALTADTFFGVIADCIPFLAVMVPVALGLTFIRKMIKGAGRGKVKC